MSIYRGILAAGRAALFTGAWVALALVGPAAARSHSGGASAPRASSRSGGSSSGSAIDGWGPHAGLAGDPDQLVLGVHFGVGRFAPRVRFQPDVELGLGDHHTIFDVTLPAHYMFRTQGDMMPYAGGGLVIGMDDHSGVRDDTEVGLGIAFTGGLEWRTAARDRFFLELNLIAGNIQDFQFVAGFTFR